MTKIEQPSPLLGEWIGTTKAFSEGRGRMAVTLTEGCDHRPMGDF